jgi:hypothetical protein
MLRGLKPLILPRLPHAYTDPYLQLAGNGNYRRVHELNPTLFALG